MADDLPMLSTLDELVELAREREDLYVRWSRGPDVDEGETSCDELTGVPLPGLSVNPLKVEPWWEGRSLRTWVARRIYDYRHLAGQRGPGVRPWVLEGEETGERGPDNEPLVRCRRAVAWLSPDIVDEANEDIEKQPTEWGSLRRR